MMRDFTYIDDVVESLVRLRAKPASPEDSWFLRNPDPATSFAPFRVYNVGNHKAVNLRVRFNSRKVARENRRKMFFADAAR
jgi:UDP-glucuronate 4-epimerase